MWTTDHQTHRRAHPTARRTTTGNAPPSATQAPVALAAGIIPPPYPAHVHMTTVRQPRPFLFLPLFTGVRRRGILRSWTSGQSGEPRSKANATLVIFMS